MNKLSRYSFSPVPSSSSATGTVTLTLKILLNSLASVVFPLEDGPERPMIIVLDGESGG